MLDYTRRSASNPLKALKSLRKLGQGDRDDRDHKRKKEQKRKKIVYLTRGGNVFRKKIYKEVNPCRCQFDRHYEKQMSPKSKKKKVWLCSS